MEHLRFEQAFDRYLDLAACKNEVIATYIFIDPLDNLATKSRTLDCEPKSLEDVPLWGAGVADDFEDSDATLTPVAMFNDPFLRRPHKLIICDITRAGKAIGMNGRTECKATIDRCADQRIMFGMEQEYTLLETDGHPYRWPKYGQPSVHPKTVFYGYGVGHNRVYGRAISDAHYLACLYAGVKIGGTNAEATPAQWEYQIGPCDGVEIGDQMLAARYILLRCSEDFGVTITFDPRPIEGHWTGTGCHTNVSTEKMRAKGGMKYITEAIEKLSQKVEEHIAVYDANGGKDNARRLGRALAAPKLTEFTWGVASRSKSVRIPRHVADQGCGYFEDRRPASNCNPYKVAQRIAATICLDE